MIATRRVRVESIVHDVAEKHGWGGKTACGVRYRHDETYVSPALKKTGYDYPIGDAVTDKEVTCLSCIGH